MSKRIKLTRKPNYITVLIVSLVILTFIVYFCRFVLSSSAKNGLKLQTAVNGNKQINKKKKVAYAITVTKDGHFVDGALVLGYSAKKVHDVNKGYNSSYDADLIAFVAPTVSYARPGILMNEQINHYSLYIRNSFGSVRLESFRTKITCRTR
jgi:hypothetical protein